MEITLQQIDVALKDVAKRIDSNIEEWRKSDSNTKAELEAKIKALEVTLNKLLEKQQQEERTHLPGVPAVTRTGEKGKFSFGRAVKLITGVAKSTDKEFGLETEVFKSMESQFDQMDPMFKTALNAATGSAGGFLIPLELYGEVIKEAQAMSIALDLGVQELYGLTGNIAWTKDKGGVTASYIDTEAEETGAESVTTFESIDVKPHVMAAFVPLTWSMLVQPAIALDQWIIKIIAKKIALRKDKSIFLGLAASKEPRGITNTPGGNAHVDFSAVVYSGTSQTLTDKLMDMIGTLATANTLATAGRLGWAMDPFVVTKISKAKDSQANPLFSIKSEVAQGRLQNLYGYKVRESTQLGATAGATGFIEFGDYSTVTDCNWGTLAFASSDQTETNFRKLRTTIRAVLAHDIMVAEAKAFSDGDNFAST